MCFANGRCLLCIAFLVLFAALLILAVVHRVRAKKKVLALTPGERVRLLNELAEPFALEGQTVHISASIGITFFPEDATDTHDLMKNADQAMYAAKRRNLKWKF